MKCANLFIFIIFLLAACDTGSQRRIDPEVFREELRKREPKKVTEVQITAEAYRQGGEIAEAAQENLLRTLKAAIEEGGLAEAVEYCQLSALPLLDSLSGQYNATIRRSSLKLRNPANAPDELERQLLEAYQYNAEEGLPLEANVQRIDKDYLLFTQPIMIESELCLSCHGKPADDIAPELVHVLDSLYPHDQAREYELGDFRGIWSIKLSQKELINAL